MSGPGRGRWGFLPEDIRECPGTWALAASWVVVFALMQWDQSRHPEIAPPGSMAGPLPVSTIISHRFGDMTWAEVRSGQPWRLVTATFVHFSIIHLGMNLLGLIKLGRLIEPWYGPGPFLAISLAMGGLGNLVGGILRQGVGRGEAWLASSGLAKTWPGLVDRIVRAGHGGMVTVHTGGGSTILLGLLGLATIVGWRSRTRIGTFLRDQMLVLLGFTALLGVVLNNLLDNYGHAGGAIVGAAIGLAHRPLFRAAERPWFRRASWIGALGLAGVCLGAGLRSDRAGADLGRRFEAASLRYRADSLVLQDLERLFVLLGREVIRGSEHLDPALEMDAAAMGDLLARGPSLGLPPRGGEPDPAQVGRDRAELDQVVTRLGQVGPSEWGEGVAADIGRMRAIAVETAEDGPRYDRVYEFVVCWRAVMPVLLADRRIAEGRLLEVDREARGPR